MAKPPVDIIGVPSDLGANMRGANLGPSAIRIAELHRKLHEMDLETADLGDLEVPVRETLPPSAPENHYLDQIAAACEQLHRLVYGSRTAGRFPVVLGGDHSIAMGSIAGLSKYHRELGQKMGLIWIDAHADLNTPDTSPSGNIHGMPLSSVLGHGYEPLTAMGGHKGHVEPQNVALIGIRSIDGREKQLCRESGIHFYTMRDIDERGMRDVMAEAIEVASNGTAALHLSLDLDGVDPLYAPGVSTPVTGGLSYRETHLGLEMIADTGRLHSTDMVELNPMNDENHKTAQLAVELIQSALGKSIV